MAPEDDEHHTDDRSEAPVTLRNSEAEWEKFAPVAYCDLNYRHLRHDDRRILHVVRDHFASASNYSRRRGLVGRGRSAAIDVGTGANLYPAFSMTPFARRLFLCDVSSANVNWIREQRYHFDESWLPFWQEFTASEPYRRVRDPRRAFARKVRVEQRNLFQLNKRAFDLGTMFFVAESLSTEGDEFRAAMHAFVGSLRPGAPFATAHMENSSGYEVNEVWFPAYAVDLETVRRTLQDVADDVYVEHVPYNVDGALREGYAGMIVAIGRAR